MRNFPKLPAGEGGDGAESAARVATILENLVGLDRILDERSRRQLGSIPYLELSKHLKIRVNGR